MTVTVRNNVKLRGAGPRAMVFAHGFGCDQNMWRFVAPAFEKDFRTVFSTMSAPAVPTSRRTIRKILNLAGYADDVVEIGRSLGTDGCRLRRAFGQRDDRHPRLAQGSEPLREPGSRRSHRRATSTMAAICGGFTQQQIDELLEFLDDNHMGWSAAMAPAIMGNPDRPELGEELVNSFCRTDPEIAKAFARVTFTSDNRADLSKGHGSYPRPAMQ